MGHNIYIMTQDDPRFTPRKLKVELCFQPCSEQQKIRIHYGDFGVTAARLGRRGPQQAFVLVKATLIARVPLIGQPEPDRRKEIEGKRYPGNTQRLVGCLVW